MVLQSEIFPGGYRQQSYSQDDYYSPGYGQGPSMHMGPTPSLGSSHMMHSGGHGPHHHNTTDFYSNGSNGHMPSVFSTGGHGPHNHTTDFYSNGSNGHMPSVFSTASNYTHGKPTGSYGSSYHGKPTGSYGSSYHGASSNFSHGIPTGSYGSSYHGATHSPMGSKVESMKHEYDNYNYGHSSMLHNPVPGGHQSAEWKLKSIEDDD